MEASESQEERALMRVWQAGGHRGQGCLVNVCSQDSVFWAAAALLWAQVTVHPSCSVRQVLFFFFFHLFILVGG